MKTLEYLSFVGEIRLSIDKLSKIEEKLEEMRKSQEQRLFLTIGILLTTLIFMSSNVFFACIATVLFLNLRSFKMKKKIRKLEDSLLSARKSYLKQKEDQTNYVKKIDKEELERFIFDNYQTLSKENKTDIDDLVDYIASIEKEKESLLKTLNPNKLSVSMSNF